MEPMGSTQGWAMKARSSGHVEIGFVNRSHLDQRRERRQYAIDFLGTLAITLGMSIHKDGVRTELGLSLIHISPTTMDQVVDRAIVREHALMDMLKNRTPLVETYLQNLKPDPQLGAVPSQDHYFLGRLDLGETVDRRDYLTLSLIHISPE